MPRVTIDSVLGGHSPFSHIGEKGQYRASLGIDPAQPIDDLDNALSTESSGLIRPSSAQNIAGSTLGSAPLWQVPNPKDANTYVYDANGSAYTVDATFSTLTALSDGGSLSSALGNGAEYYDNYIYFAKNTDIARYGPLDGSPAFTGSYWVGTLGKTALVNTVYPTDFTAGIRYPNHVMHRHSDGNLYIADVVGNQGTIHYIATKKTTVEGDTDNASTYNKVQVGYGLWPTAIESYGSDLAVAFIEVSTNNKRDMKAKLAFWDTSSTKVNKITWVEFPDQLITALKNVNGTLYVISGSVGARGFRVTKFVGGYSFEEVDYVESATPCFPGAVEGIMDRLLMGTATNYPEADGCVFSVGLQLKEGDAKEFNVMRATGGNSSTIVTSLVVAQNNNFGFYTPNIGWTKGTGTSNNGLDKQGTQYNNAPSVFWSEVFRIGAPFEIDRIRIPFAQALAANMTLTAKIYLDDGSTTVALTTINSTNFPNSDRAVALKVPNVRGVNNFWVELRWTGSALLTVSLPIPIDFHIIED